MSTSPRPQNVEGSAAGPAAGTKSRRGKSPELTEAQIAAQRPTMTAEYADQGTDVVQADGKIRHSSLMPMVEGPNGKMYYRGSSWEEAHAVPAAELKDAPPKEFVHIFHPRSEHFDPNASAKESKISPSVQQGAAAPAEAASGGGVKFDLTMSEEQTTAAPTTPPAETLPPAQGKEASKSKSKKKRQPSIFTVRNKLSEEVRPRPPRPVCPCPRRRPRPSEAPRMRLGRGGGVPGCELYALVIWCAVSSC